MVVLSHLSLTFFPYLHLGGFPENNDFPIQKFFYESPFSFFYSGTSAIFIFFVLSGYILSYVALGKSDYRHKFLKMSIKRYPRLAIPTIVSCLLALSLFSLFNFDTSHLSEWITKYGNFDFSLAGAIYSGAIQSFFMGESDYNPVIWTMKIELFGSFLIFLICYFRKSNKKRVENFILFLGSLLIITGVNGSKTSLGLVGFLMGYLFYLYGRETSTKISIPLFVAGLYFAGIHNESVSYSLLYDHFGDEIYKICNFFSGLLIVYSILFNRILNALFSRDIFVFIGKISFSAYLVHLPVISTIGVCTFNMFNSFSFAYHNSAISASIVSIFSTYLVSVLYYKKIDVLGMKMSNNFSNKVLGYID